MKSIIGGYSLLAASIITLFLLGSGIEAVPADAGWGCWLGIWITAAVAVAAGIIGMRELELRE